MLDRIELLLAAEIERIATTLRQAAEPSGIDRLARNEWLAAHPVSDFVAPALRRLEATRRKLVELRRE